MIPFKEFQRDCIFRKDRLCSYWERTTECHVLSCPFYSNILSSKQRDALEKRIRDSVTFHPSDLDRSGSSIQDLIEKTRTEGTSQADQDSHSPKRSSLTEKMVTRLTCLACGEKISDDKYTTIKDPHGVLIYLHSKGKCQVRRDRAPLVRERWLKMHQIGEAQSENGDQS
jgi:hypothetical protein